eukprot:8442376-Alexandrium_andersonii.AAC.1
MAPPARASGERRRLKGRQPSWHAQETLGNPWKLLKCRCPCVATHVALAPILATSSQAFACSMQQ